MKPTVLRIVFCSLLLPRLLCLPLSADEGSLPIGEDGRLLNFDFEDGTLRDWRAAGAAFEKQPVRGDTVSPRRGDMRSGHQGEFWIGTYERTGDDPQGTLASAPFTLTHPFASFLVAGGPWPETRVELIRADTAEVIFKTSGYEHEQLRPVVVDLAAQKDRKVFIRIVDQRSGHWGHINFDNFRFHSERPQFANELDPKTISRRDELPPVDQVQFAGLSPEEAVKAITLPPGFKAQLFAAEPDVRQPVAMALDHRGRLWIAECFTYPQRAPEGQGTDRILIFEDTDGDHQFNKRTVFAEGLNFVTGLEVGFGGVWVGAAPYFMFIPDRDGDDQPDGPPEILLDGWGYQDTHETLNTFTWGPDGWLYGCHGVFTHSKVGKPGTPDAERVPLNAGVWRYHPAKHEFEVFAHGTRNPWGIDVDERGQCLIEACVIPHLFHVVQGARYHRQAGAHFNPHTYDDIKTIADHVHWMGDRGWPHAANNRSDAAGGGHAHAGLMIYQGDSWPEEYRGKVFMNNIHGARVNMDLVERNGSGFVGRHGEDFLMFNDKWSQALNFRTDQNGSVYIIDWYDRQQCHNNNPNDHDRGNGRIYKIVYGDEKWTPVDLEKKSDEQLVDLVANGNSWNARHAQRILQERADARMREGTPAEHADALVQRFNPEPTLAKVVRGDAADSTRLRALWTLHAINRADDKILAELMRDKDEAVRAWAIQLSAEAEVPRDALLEEMRQLAHEDESPLVRLYLASALQRFPTSDRWNILQGLLNHAEDSQDHNLPLMYWYAAEPLVEIDPARALALAANGDVALALNFTTRRVAALGTADAHAAIVNALKGIVGKDASRELEMLRGFHAALAGLRNVAMPAGWDQIEQAYASVNNPDLRSAAEALSVIFGSSRALANLRKTLTDPVASTDARMAALESLLSAKDASLAPLLQSLLSEAQLRSAALRALAAYDDTKTPPAILSVYGSLNAEQKRDALNTLVSRAPFARALLTAVGDGRVPRQDVTAELIRQLRQFNNEELNREIERVWGAVRERTEDKQQAIERFAHIYRSGGSQPGDASRGREVFSRICQQCHTLFDTGAQVGPDLTGSNRGDLNYILENMLDPNAVIPNEYRTTTINTKDDRVITGIVKAEDDNTVTITTANETLVVPREEIASQRAGSISMMPEGLIEALSEQEVRDLIYYLSRPAQVPMPDAQW